MKKEVDKGGLEFVRFTYNENDPTNHQVFRPAPKVQTMVNRHDNTGR